jgi:hypothetical protein
MAYIALALQVSCKKGKTNEWPKAEKDRDAEQ